MTNMKKNEDNNVPNENIYTIDEMSKSLLHFIMLNYQKFAAKSFINGDLFYFKIYSNTFTQEEILDQLNKEFPEGYDFDSRKQTPYFINDNEDMLEVMVQITPP